MSMPMIDYVCEECGPIGSSNITWGPHFYESELGLISIHRRPGWCRSCEKIQAIEDFSDTDSVYEALQEASQGIENYGKLSLKNTIRRLMPSPRYFFKSDLQELNSSAWLLALFARRRGTERCMVCASQQVDIFNKVPDLKYDGLFYQGEEDIDFQHPACGSTVIVRGSDIRPHIKFYKQRIYSEEGVFLREETVDR